MASGYGSLEDVAIFGSHAEALEFHHQPALVEDGGGVAELLELLREEAESAAYQYSIWQDSAKKRGVKFGLTA